jgi:hypothetical protein
LVFFTLSSWELALIIFAVIGGATLAGLAVGRRLREHKETLSESFGVLQGALLGLVALILAFGLSLAVGRYESRRQAVVDDANAIGTAYLRAQTLTEPIRSRSLALIVSYTDASIALSHDVPGSTAQSSTIATQNVLIRRLWRLAGESLNEAPLANAPRLYVDSLNELINLQTERIAALNNRVPGPVLTVEVIGAAIALALLSLYLAMLGRGVAMVILAAALVTFLLLVTFDLDRPTRGLIKIPTAPLVSLRTSMVLPPAATGPKHP